MPKNHWTAAEFIAYAEKHGLQLKTIAKEVPKGSGRVLIFGFEMASKRSGNYAKKFMFRNPIELSKLHEGPILKNAQQSTEQPAAADSSTGAGPATPAVQRGV